MGNGVATLAELLGVVPGAEVEDKAVTWQHTSESPRQMMLGCRKGVKWYGNKCSEPVFKDDLCAGSLLHFRCDYFFDEDGEATQVRLWLLPSPAAFRRTGRRVTQLSEPLFEWQATRDFGGAREPAKRSVWVPAVTLFSRHDVVLFAWHGLGQGAPAAASAGCKGGEIGGT